MHGFARAPQLSRGVRLHEERRVLEGISCCRRLKGPLSALGVVAILTALPCFAAPKVPLKSALKIRVGQFYAAYIKQDWPALLELMAPFVRECQSAEDFRLGWTEDGPGRVLSWRLVDIDYDPVYVGQEFKVECTGKAYRVDAGAMVVTSQLDQEGEGKPERGENYLRWVLIGGVWFAAGPE